MALDPEFQRIKEASRRFAYGEKPLEMRRPPERKVVEPKETPEEYNARRKAQAKDREARKRSRINGHCVNGHVLPEGSLKCPECLSARRERANTLRRAKTARRGGN